MVILFGDLPKEIFKQSLDAGIVQIERFPVDQKYNECHAQKMDEEYWQVPRQLCYTGPGSNPGGPAEEHYIM